MNIYLCLVACLVVYASLADGVTEEANDDLGGQDEFGGEYHEFDAKDLNCQQKFAGAPTEASLAYSSLMHLDPIFKHNS